MADTVAQIDVQVTLDTKDFDKGIDNTHKKAERLGLVSVARLAAV